MTAPGRKTDAKDREWIAWLLRRALLQGSFVQERCLRELSNLTEHRAKLVRLQASLADRIQKMLGNADVKPASVTSEVPEESGVEMIEALIGCAPRSPKPPGRPVELTTRVCGPNIVVSPVLGAGNVPSSPVGSYRSGRSSLLTAGSHSL